MVLKAALLFILAGIAEIGGGYLIWQWLREGKTWYVGLCGGVILAVYGIIATFQVFPPLGVYMQHTEVSLLFFPLHGAGGLIKRHPTCTISLVD